MTNTNTSTAPFGNPAFGSRGARKVKLPSALGLRLRGHKPAQPGSRTRCHCGLHHPVR